MKFSEASDAYIEAWSRLSVSLWSFQEIKGKIGLLHTFSGIYSMSIWELKAILLPGILRQEQSPSMQAPMRLVNDVQTPLIKVQSRSPVKFVLQPSERWFSPVPSSVVASSHPAGGIVYRPVSGTASRQSVPVGRRRASGTV